MIIKTTFDIETKQPVYAICNAQHQCGVLTTSIINAIQFAQCTDLNQVQSLLNA